MVCIGVLYLSGDGWYVCRVGAQSTSEPKMQDRPKPSRGSGLGKTRPGTPRRNRVVETPYCWRLTKYHLTNRGEGNCTIRYRRLRYRILHRLKNRGTPKPYNFLRFSKALPCRALEFEFFTTNGASRLTKIRNNRCLVNIYCVVVLYLNLGQDCQLSCFRACGCLRLV